MSEITELISPRTKKGVVSEEFYFEIAIELVLLLFNLVFPQNLSSWKINFLLRNFFDAK